MKNALTLAAFAAGAYYLLAKRKAKAHKAEHSPGAHEIAPAKTSAHDLSEAASNAHENAAANQTANLGTNQPQRLRIGAVPAENRARVITNDKPAEE